MQVFEASGGLDPWFPMRSWRSSVTTPLIVAAKIRVTVPLPYETACPLGERKVIFSVID